MSDADRQAHCDREELRRIDALLARDPTLALYATRVEKVEACLKRARLTDRALQLMDLLDRECDGWKALADHYCGAILEFRKQIVHN